MLRKHSLFSVELPDDLLQTNLFKFFRLRDKAALANTHIQFAKLPDYQKANAELVRILPQFLQLVARGKQIQAEVLLKKNPDLALLKCQVTDYSDRTFINISAIQYAAWAYDIHMLKMLLKHIPDDEKYNTYEQLTDLEKHGTEHGTHYDVSPLIQALQKYVDNCVSWDYEQCVDYLCTKIGTLQRHVPAHIANEYCHPTRSFDPIHQFKENHLPRSFLLFKISQDRDSYWYPLFTEGLGINFAIVSFPNNTPEIGSVETNYADRYTIALDLETLSLLMKARSAELQEIKQQLFHHYPRSLSLANSTHAQ